MCYSDADLIRLKLYSGQKIRKAWSMREDLVRTLRELIGAIDRIMIIGTGIVIGIMIAIVVMIVSELETEKVLEAMTLEVTEDLVHGRKNGQEIMIATGSISISLSLSNPLSHALFMPFVYCF